MGRRLNPGIGVKAEPNTGLISEAFALLNRLKNSATRSRCFAAPNGKYLRTRKFIVISRGVLKEFLPRLNGRDDRGKVWVRFESRPVNGSSGRPLSTVKIGATWI